MGSAKNDRFFGMMLVTFISFGLIKGPIQQSKHDDHIAFEAPLIECKDRIW